MYCCRVIRELDAVKQEAALLQDQMKMVKQDIQKVSMSVKYRAENFSKLINTQGLFTKVWVILGHRYMCSYRMQIRK